MSVPSTVFKTAFLRNLDNKFQRLLPPKAQQIWNHPAGPKTIHGWCPVAKWVLAAAGAADFFRPASTLSPRQNFTLGLTGMVWTRYCFVITPRNMLLAACNFALGVVGFIQVGRCLNYEYNEKPQLEASQQQVKSVE